MTQNVHRGKKKKHEFKAHYSKEKQFIHIYAILMR